MKITDRLSNFNYMSDHIRLYIGRIIAVLNELDMLEGEAPTTDEEVEERERKTDNLMVDMFEFIQWIGTNYNQIDYGCEFSALKKELEDELLNDFTVSTDILRRKLKRFEDIVRDSIWPFVWDETEYLNFTHSLNNGELANRVKHHLLKAPTMTEFWERMEWSKDYTFIINGKPLDECRAEQIARDWVWRLEYYFRQGFLYQELIMNKIEEADNELNPCPNTSTDATQSTFKQSPVLSYPDVVEWLKMAEKEGLVKQFERGWIWLKDNEIPLLAYFCQQICRHSKNIKGKILNGEECVNWAVFKDCFWLQDQRGGYSVVTTSKLKQCKADQVKSRTALMPDGYGEIDNIFAN